MNTIIDFLSNEPIENMITCLNFKADRVVFFGYDEVIREQKRNTEHFLTRYCGVQKVLFYPLSQSDLPSALTTMRARIVEEMEQGHSVYADITGGESMILVALGILSNELKMPLFRYEIDRNRLIELDTGSERLLSRDVPPNHVDFDIDRYIEMCGGAINYSMHKNMKSLGDPDFAADAEAIWKTAEKHRFCWTAFTEFLKSRLAPDDGLRVSRRTRTVKKGVEEAPSALLTFDVFDEMIRELADSGVLLDLQIDQEYYRFSFKNLRVKECLWESGCILELHTYMVEKEQSDDCMAGVHLDWDGALHSRAGEDVLNEIDVLSVKGNLITFISCKTGRLGSSQSLYALYELQTIAERFGGRYARKKLVLFHPLNEIYLQRAEEMGIEVVIP